MYVVLLTLVTVARYEAQCALVTCHFHHRRLKLIWQGGIAFGPEYTPLRQFIKRLQ